MQEVGLVECLRQSDLLERGPANACPGSISIPGLLPGANERLRRSTTRTESIDRPGFARGSSVGPRLRGKRADGRSRNAAPCIDIIRRVIGVVGRSGDTGLVPRVYVALASHGGSCECGGGDQRSRQKCNWTHLISPSIRKANGVGSCLQMERRSTYQSNLCSLRFQSRARSHAICDHGRGLVSEIDLAQLRAGSRTQPRR
jgi:hypothetical protein